MKNGLAKTNCLFLLGSLFLGVFFAFSVLQAKPVQASTGVNQTINFQGRLLNTAGAVVPDGFYNIQFKIYQDGDGQTAGDTTGSPSGSLKWTESYLNQAGKGVKVVNGYMSVQLGSLTAFGSNIDWNQSTLWLSMNIAGTGASCTPFSACTPDGEMLPMQPLTSSPYSLNSGQLGGLTSSQFVQLAQGVQTDGSTASSLGINKTGASGNIVQLQKSGVDVLVVDNSGTALFRPASDSATALQVQNRTSGYAVLSVDTTGNQVVLGTSGSLTGKLAFATAGGGTLTINPTSSASPFTLTLPAETGTVCTTATTGVCATAGTGFVQLAPTSAQADSTNNSSINLNKGASATGNLLTLQKNGTTVVSIGNTGNTTFENSTNSNSAFQIQNAAATNIFNADTINSTISLGNNNSPYAMQLPGTSGAYASTPDSVGNSITGDIDLQARVALTDWTPAASNNILGKHNASFSYQLAVLSSGLIRLTWSADGSTTISKDSTVAPTVSDGQRLWVRATLKANNGAGGNDVKFYTATDSPNIPGSWTQLGSTVTTAGTTSIFNSTDGVEIGTFGAGTGNIASGTFYRALIFNGIGGTLANDFDPLRAATTASTTFTASTGETWTRNGAAAFVANSTATISSIFASINTAATVRNNTDSTAAFQIQNAGGTNVFDVDTTNGRIGINNSAPGNRLTINTPVTADSLAQEFIATGADGNKGLVIQRNSTSQTGDLLEIQGSAGTPWLSITGTAGIDLHTANSQRTSGSIDSDALILLNSNTITEGGNTLKSGFQAASSGNDTLLTNIRSASTSTVFGGGVNGDTARRVLINADGSYNVGSGSATADTILQRQASGGFLITDTATGNPQLALKERAGQGVDTFQVQDSSGNAEGGFDSAGQLYVGRVSALTGNIKLYNSGGSGSISFAAANPSSTNYTITVPAETGTICTTAGSSACTAVYAPASGTVLLAPSSVQADSSTNNSIFINKTGASGNILDLQRSASDVFKVDNSGNVASTGQNTLSRTGSGANDYTLGVTGTPAASSTSSLIRVGNAITGGNGAANGGTYLSIVQPSSGAGSAADFFNFQNGSTVEMQLTAGGNLTVNGTYDTNTFNNNTLGFGGNSAATISSSGSNNITLDTGSSGGTLALGNNATTTNLGTSNAAHTIGIGTGGGGTTTQAITIGAATNGSSTLTLQGGNGSTSILLQTGNNGGTAGGIQIGNTSGAFNQTISIGTNNSASNIVNIGTGTGQDSVTVGDTTNASSSVAIKAGSTGGISLGANTTLSANSNLTYASGTGKFDAHNASGTFDTSTGNNSLNGNTTVTGTNTFTVNGGATTLNGASAGSGTAAKVNTNAASNVGLVVQGASSQTAALLQLQDSSGAALLGVAANGDVDSIGILNTPYGGLGGYGNLIVQSEQLGTTWSATNITVTQNDGASNPAPDGNTTADKLVSSASGTHTLSQTYSSAGNNTYTFSIWLKSATPPQPVQLRIDSNGTPASGTAASFSVTGSWQRYSVTQTFTSGVSSVTPTLVISNNNTSVVGWGAQLIQGSSAGVYGRTGAATVLASSGLVSNGSALFQAISNSATAYQFQNSSGVNVAAIDTSGAQLVLGASGTTGGKLAFATAGGGTLTINPTSSASNFTITLPAENGTVCTTAGSSACTAVYAPAGGGYVNFAPASVQADSSNNNTVFINKTSGTGNIFELQKSGADVFKVDNSGNVASTGQNTISRNGTGSSDYTLGITGTTSATGTSSLVRIGGALSGGNGAANGGTYLSIVEPGSGAGSAADFLNFQNGSTVEMQLASNGNLTVGGTYNGNTFDNTGHLTFGNAGAAIISSNGSNNITIDTGSSGGIETIGNNAATTNIGTSNAAHTIAIGTGGAGTTTQTITIGANTNSSSSLTLQGGNGSAAIVLQTGDNGSGTAGTIGIGNTSGANSQTISIGTNATASAANIVHIGDAATAQDTVTIGSTSNAASSVAISGGSTGGITLSASTTNINSATVATNQSNIAVFNSPTNITEYQAGTSISIGATTGTLTLRNANQTFGNAAGTGLFTNNGATVNSTLALSNFNYTGSGNTGSIGSAASTIDVYTSISISQSTAGQTLTIPSPTASGSYGRVLYLSNIGTTGFTVGSALINTGATATLIWANSTGGASWQFAGADAASILNQTSVDQSANFRISGTGRANTSFITPLVDALSGGALSVGTSSATGVTIGGTTNTTSVLLQGAAGATYTIGSSNNTGGITLGNSTATNTISIGGAAGNGNTQTIGIGNSSTAGSSTNITIGSSIAGSTTLQSGTTNINSSTIATSLSSLTLFNTSASNVTAFGAGTTISIGATTGTITLKNANTTIGNAAGSGVFTNNGATLNATLALGDLAAGSLGSAATTVDIYTSFSIAPTASARAYTIPAPTASTSYGRAVYVSNIASSGNYFTISGIRIPPGSTGTLIWSNTSGGASWQFAGAGGASIENQNSADQSANFRIAGTGTLNVSSTTAFQVQDGSSNAVLTVNTSGSIIQIGSSTSNAGTQILVLNNNNGTTTPTEVDGGMYYNNATSQFMCGENGFWVNCGVPPRDHSYDLYDEFMNGMGNASIPTQICTSPCQILPTNTTGIGGLNWYNSLIGTPPSTLQYLYNQTGGNSPTADANRPGILDIQQTGTGNNTGQTMSLGIASMKMGTSLIDLKTAVNVTGGNLTVLVGLDNETTAVTAPTTGAYFKEAGNGAWNYCYVNGTPAETCTSSGVTATAGSWYSLEIKIVSSTEIDYFINGTKFAATSITYNTTNKISPAFTTYKTSGTPGTLDLYIDYFELLGTTTTGR